MKWYEKKLAGHISFIVFKWRVVIYGFNAMHVAINVGTYRWGYLCFHPPFKVFGHWWPWYFYISPNATPWASTYAIGPGVSKRDKALAAKRRRLFGDNFDTTKNAEALQSLNQS